MFDWVIAPVSALISIATGGALFAYVSNRDAGNQRLREIAAAIKEGADAFLKREFIALA